MSKRLFVLMMTLMLFALSAVANAQDQGGFVLTEQQINADFRIPSTATRQISNLEVDVQEDGVRMSFNLKAITDGTSNTMMVGAVLTGVYQPEQHRVVWTFSDILVESVTATGRQRRELTNLIGRAWRSYVEEVIEANGFSINFTKITYTPISFAIDIGTSED